VRLIGIVVGSDQIGDITMPAGRRVKLFRIGRDQAVRIPREFELSGVDATMRKEGDRLIIESCLSKSLLAVLATLQPLHVGFPAIEDPAPDSVEL
jgi:antitoxin VapB